MEQPLVFIHPALKYMVDQYAELEENRAKLRAVAGLSTYERIEKIIEKESTVSRRSAFYGTITDAARGGSDFSKVENLKDIADVYAKFICKRCFGEGDQQ